MNKNLTLILMDNEDLEPYFLVEELLSQIQRLAKEVVRLREEVNSYSPGGSDVPYSIPVSGIPYSLHYDDFPAMRVYEEIFGVYIPEY